MNESDAYVYDEIRKWVWSGFYSQDEIQEMLEDILEDDCDETMLRASVASQWQAKQQAEQTWPAQTDCDRLDALFERLHEAGICALANAGYTMSDDHVEVNQAVAGAPDRRYHGYCFYHGQDMERAIDGGGLMLAFGDLDRARGGGSGGRPAGRRGVACGGLHHGLGRHAAQAHRPARLRLAAPRRLGLTFQRGVGSRWLRDANALATIACSCLTAPRCARGRRLTERRFMERMLYRNRRGSRHAAGRRLAPRAALLLATTLLAACAGAQSSSPSITPAHTRSGPCRR
ncbi:hypothetical protein NG831_21435 [Xanthomonas sacchari]|nr:hypothetical protein [Xanthomonas sacchari]UYK66619.1 hypothetical protein NG831_21435 [Xanthomonas sacchari]